MKKLTQAIFDDAPEWVKTFALDSNGELHAYAVEKKYLSSCHLYHHAPLGSYSEFYDDGYDASDWENSAIDRGSEATNKEKLESLVSDINNNINLLVDAFSKDTGISVNDVYVELSVECYDSSLDE